MVGARRWAGILLLLVMLVAGCSQPKIAASNLRLTMALRTAVSARNTEWLAACREQVETRRQAEEVSAEEYDRFCAIVALAEKGDWTTAERDVVRWQAAQRPER